MNRPLVAVVGSGDVPQDDPRCLVAQEVGRALVDRGYRLAHAEAVVAIGGGAGTLSEVALAWVLDRPIVAFRIRGWSGKLADTRLDGRVRFSDRPDDRVYGVASTGETIARLDELLAME